MGRYQLLARRGPDAVLSLYLAVALEPAGSKELVVLHCVPSEVAAEAGAGAALVEDGKLAGRLEHPNMVRTLGVGEESGQIYVATEYLEGQTLEAVGQAARKARSPLEPALCARLVSDALTGLHYAHELKDGSGPLALVHRNINPGTVFVTYDGEVKVTDFGGAKERLLQSTESEESAKRRLGHMAPEQVSGRQVDRRADVFAMGIVLWELLTGRALMDRETAPLTLQRVLQDALEPPSTFAKEIDRELDTIVLRALERDPARRFQSAEGMRMELETYLFGRGATAERVTERMQALFGEARERERVEVLRLLSRLRPSIAPPPAPPPLPVRRAGGGGAGAPPPESWRSVLSDPPPPPAPRPPPPRPGMSAAMKALLGVGALVVVGAGAVLVATFLKQPVVVPVVEEAAAPPIARTVLRLHGSNVMGADLVPALVEAFLKGRGATGIARHPGPRPLETDVKATLGGSEQVVEIEAQGTSTAFDDLAAGKCDIGMASRLITSAEAATLAPLGDMTLPANEHLLGLDGIAVIVHPNNPLRSIDTARLHDVFSGQLKDWADLSGRPGPIEVYAPGTRSGTYDIFSHLVLGEDPLVATAKRVPELAALAKAVAGGPNAIGFTSFHDVQGAEALAVSEPGSTPLYPSPFTVATEDYLLTRRMYLYVPAAATPLATDFVTFAVSPEGQRVVKSAGFVDLTVRISDPSPCVDKCPPRYLAISRRARRLSLTFRFRSGGSDFDSRSYGDIDRLLELLKAYPNPHVIVLGFSDIVGDPTQSLALSKERAGKVNDELVARGIHPTIVDGFGLELPRASNATAAGRERNRRVEVWLDKD